MRVKGLEGEHRMMPEWASLFAVRGLARLLLDSHGPTKAMMRAKHLTDSASKAKSGKGPLPGVPTLCRELQELISREVVPRLERQPEKSGAAAA